jgi:hypothetical protein
LAGSDRLSLEYKRDWKGKRDPIVLVIPGYGGYCLDYAYWPDQGGHGWTITGEVPNITASPSLGIGRDDQGSWCYHGWLRNGVLSDDIEGRKYDEPQTPETEEPQSGLPPLQATQGQRREE